MPSQRSRTTFITLLVAIAALALSAAPALANNPGALHAPDIETVIPTNQFSIVGTGASREFRYTHLVYNAGPGPLAIQPEYIPTSGNYQGHQQLYTHDAGGAWQLVRDRPVPDAFIFHAEHGHFHFPLASFGLYAVAADGGLGAPVALSPKNGFCIDDSYIYDNTVPHAGQFAGTKGSCYDPATRRGMSVGAVDEYDYRDPGQAIPFAGVPDGTFWFKAVSDPNNDFEEADESDNETDVKVTVANNQVTAGEIRHPDTTPPAATLVSPAQGAVVGGTTQLKVDTPVTGAGRVEFLIDGNVVGTSTDTAAPYTLGWNTTTVVDGAHWVAARVTDAQGRINTTPVNSIVVNNSPEAPPVPPGVFATDGQVSADGRNAITAPPLRTSQAGDLILAFVGSDGPSTAGSQTVTVSGGGLSWSLVKRQNGRAGTSEIWKAIAPTSQQGLGVTSTPLKSGYDQSIHVVAFAGAAGVGATSGASATSGAPSTSLTTTKAGSWVFGVGNDWDNSVARAIGPNQQMLHQWVNTAAGDTMWMQSQVAPTPNSGTLVAINDTSPTQDRWNLAAVEVQPGAAAPPPPADTQAPRVTVTGPSGPTVSGITTLAATASDNVGVTSVQFKIDGQPIGAPVTAPPFMSPWDTRSATPGQHTITAEAVDAAGNLGASAGVVVTVDNSAPPPAAIGVDTAQFVHAKGTLKTPALTTPTAGDTLVAFVSIDGPAGAQRQSATVTGGGLTWTLVKRSDSQAGVSEIWSAKAAGTVNASQITATPQVGGYDGLLHVMAFKNARGVGVAGASGAASGAPDIYLPGVDTGAWVFAVGNDWDRAVGRTPVAGQVLQHQWIDGAAGDTFWVQSTSAPNTAPGLVTIHDNAPTNDRWNYAAVAVLPAAAGS